MSMRTDNPESPFDEVKRLRKNNKMLAKALSNEKLQTKEWKDKFNDLRNEYLNLLEVHNSQQNKLENIKCILLSPRDKSVTSESSVIEKTKIPLQQNTNVPKSFKHMVKPMISGHAITLPNIYLKRMNLANIEPERDLSKFDQENEEENNFVTVRRQGGESTVEETSDMSLDLSNNSNENIEEPLVEENRLAMPSELNTIVEESLSENMPSFVVMSTPKPSMTFTLAKDINDHEIHANTNQSLDDNINGISPIHENRESTSEISGTPKIRLEEASNVFINFRRPRFFPVNSSETAITDAHTSEMEEENGTANNAKENHPQDDENEASSSTSPAKKMSLPRDSRLSGSTSKCSTPEITPPIKLDQKKPKRSRKRQNTNSDREEAASATPSTPNINSESSPPQRRRRKPINYKELSLGCKLRR